MINFITNRLLKLVHFFSKIMIKTKILIELGV